VGTVVVKQQPDIEQTATPASDELTDKEQAFINEYFLCGYNGAEAARRAGYSARSARVTAHRILTNANVRAEIDRRLAEHGMTANEAIARLASQARGDIADLLDREGNFDLKRAKKDGRTHLIKKLKRKRSIRLGKEEGQDDVLDEYVEIELYDAQSALETLLKQWQLDNDKPTERVEVKGYIGFSPDDWDESN
jgi:phage terminase small subunit